MNMITNPILTGFNPDPSICRVGDDFYIATSTFDWVPALVSGRPRLMQLRWREKTMPRF